MECGLVGLPGSGKTTLFNALTGMQVDAFAGGKKPHIGVAKIPDPRLDIIARYIPPRKIVHATLQLVDIPGVPPGGGAEKLNAFLSHVRQVDGICHVVRCFDDGSGVIDPADDIEQMQTELVLADMVVVEGGIDRAARAARSGDKDAQGRLEALQKASAVLDDGRPVRSGGPWPAGEQAVFRSYGLITAKPVLFVANLAEAQIGKDDPAAGIVRAYAADHESEAVALCAKLEAELSELEEADRAEMLQSLGLEEPAIGPLARAVNATLGLSTFYTAGDKEVRAWVIPAGSSAPDAAGAIHTDIQRGFIRAECFSVDELVQYKSEKAVRDAGKLRSEGKHYTLQDGDIVHFLFNV